MHTRNGGCDPENWRAGVEQALHATQGILDVRWIDANDRQKIRQFEKELQERGLGGLGKYCNEGVLKVLGSQHVCAVLNNNEFRHATEPCLSWVVGEVVIGEEVSDPKRLEALKKLPGVKVFGKNFVVFFDRIKATGGKQPTFVFRALAFPEIEGIPGVRDVLSASPHGSADLFLKEKFGWEAGKLELGTILIGFNLDPLCLDCQAEGTYKDSG